MNKRFRTRCEYIPVRSLRPSLGATLRAAHAVQIVCPDDLLPSAVPLLLQGQALRMIVLKRLFKTVSIVHNLEGGMAF